MLYGGVAVASVRAIAIRVSLPSTAKLRSTCQRAFLLSGAQGLLSSWRVPRAGACR